jgi:hypothetical protein
LISQYVDGELKDDQIAQLAAALEADVASVDRLVFAGFIHTQLITWLGNQGEAVHEGSSILENDELLSAMASSGMAPPRDESRKVLPQRTSDLFARTRRRFFSPAALAAVFLATISVVAYVIASRPDYVGQLTEATGCQWAASPPGIQVGTLLESGQELNLTQGRAIITFSSGAKLMMEGPTTVRLSSSKEIFLLDGKVAAKVPRPAIGFTVKSSLARFVDLGTAFTLTLRAEKAFELHVFEGLVEMRLDERFGERVHKPVYVAAVHAQQFNVGDSDVTPIQFEEGKQMPF